MIYVFVMSMRHEPSGEGEVEAAAEVGLREHGGGELAIGGDAGN